MNKPTIILFQGDSITDAFRNREAEEYRGCGYPTMVAGQLGLRFPGQYTFLNRGVSGDRVPDLLARWERECINLHPDVVSILIGINDVWHEHDFAGENYLKKYETVYNLLLDQTMQDLPGVKLMVLEPFVLCGSGTKNVWNFFSEKVPLYQTAARRVAEAHNAVFVPLQQALEDCCGQGDTSNWLVDGVHPTAAGHTLIAQEWLHAFSPASESKKGEKAE